MHCGNLTQAGPLPSNALAVPRLVAPLSPVETGSPASSSSAMLVIFTRCSAFASATVTSLGSPTAVHDSGITTQCTGPGLAPLAPAGDCERLGRKWLEPHRKQLQR